jgi:hypothetical protein
LHIGESVIVQAPAPVSLSWMQLSLREKAALCLRISRGLSWNNPARLQLMELAERLEGQAKEFELQNHLAEKVA